MRADFEKQASQLSEDLNALRPGTGPGIRLLLLQAYEQGVKDENEPCAKMIEAATWPKSLLNSRTYTEFERGGDNYLKMMAGAIRARKI